MKRASRKTLLSRHVKKREQRPPAPVAQESPEDSQTNPTTTGLVQLRAPLGLVGLAILDKQGRLCELNGAAARSLGFARSWLIGRPFVVFIAQYDVERFLRALITAADNPDPQLIELDLSVRNQNLPVHILLSGIRKADEAFTYQMEILDITELKKVEVQLRESLQQWQTFMFCAPDVILTVNREGKILFANKELRGYSATAMVATNILSYVPQRERRKLRVCLNASFKYSRRVTCEVEFRSETETSWFSFTFGAVQSVHDSTTTVVVRDISEAKRAQQLLHDSSDQLRNLAARAEAIREEERAHVAREIHDELGQALTVLKLELAGVQQNPRASITATRVKLEDIIVQVDSTIDRVRRIAAELRPSILDHFGLKAAIQWQAEQIEKCSGMQISVKSDSNEDSNLPSEISIVGFRVVQEALTNVIRHARAHTVEIVVNERMDRLRLSIVDDGQGMPPERATDMKSLGILGMKERIARVGGQLRISSMLGRGTRLDINIPIRRNAR